MRRVLTREDRVAAVGAGPAGGIDAVQARRAWHTRHARHAHHARRAWLAAFGAVLPVALLGLGIAVPAQAATRRIVSVGGALTELLYALGAEGDLVGTDTTSLYPPAVEALPRVGYSRALSAEGVLSLRPTLVVAGADAGPPAVLRQLAAAGVRLEQVDLAHSPEGLQAAVRRLGQLAQRPEAAERLAQRLDADLAAARRRVTELATGREAPRVLFVLSHAMNQVRISGRGTAAHAMIELAGGRNAFGQVEGYKPLAPEAAIAAAPDVILCTDQGLEAAGGIDGLLRAPGLAATPAGRARRVRSIEALLLLGFGPRLPQAVAQLAEALHGGAAPPGRGGRA
jgi:iron complex transport system substrate-binding protein